jgi:hypothetical protein
VRSWDVLQQALFAQHPGWHATGLDAFDRTHDIAGNRSVAAQSASPTATETVTLPNISLSIAQSGPLVDVVEHHRFHHGAAKSFGAVRCGEISITLTALVGL